MLKREPFPLSILNMQTRNGNTNETVSVFSNTETGNRSKWVPTSCSSYRNEFKVKLGQSFRHTYVNFLSEKAPKLIYVNVDFSGEVLWNPA
jgi:hypothetical protein